MTHVEIPLRNRDLVALVDQDDAALVANRPWRLMRSSNSDHIYAGYQTTVAGKVINVYMHRLILPDAPEVDHVNGDGLDNRRSNIRGVTHAQNMMNKKRYRNNRSGFKGVYWHKGKGTWVAQIAVNGRKHLIGRYATKEDAARAYDAKALELHGPFARLNYPPDEVRQAA